MSVATGARLGALLSEHREALESIVRATNVFADDEVAVALELFDDAIAGGSDYEFIGAFEEHRLVGYACFGATPSTDNTYDLYWIAVHPEAQRSGAGSLLMSEVEHRLHARRARLLIVETSSRADYEPTRRFYERRGYQESARIHDFYGNGDHRLVLTKSLAVGA
ncbi:MAG TPA: GNAT family N-acetyltransferase [Gemmatimonadaceae bacterium]